MAPRLRSADSKKGKAEENGGGGGLVCSIAKLYQKHEEQGWSILPWVLFLADAALSVVVVLKAGYTEIDWVAYMQEVASFLEDGETNYLNMKGDTGPLVYPGGFVWIYSLLFKITDKGSNVRLAQWVFLGIYLLTLLLVFRLYQRTSLAPLWIMPLLILSKRLHSIYMLRMFNDGIAMCLLYAAVLFFSTHKWARGCIFYSLALSVKMNILLFAPGLALLLLQALGFWSAALHIFLCGLVQLVVAYPFLYHHPLAYLSKAFELTRTFQYEWTVNFRFLPEEVFLSKALAILLLLALLLALGAFAWKWIVAPTAPRIVFRRSPSLPPSLPLSPDYVIYTLFVSNFLGVAFARTLHYQFYAWYFHTLPALAFASLPPSFPPSFLSSLLRLLLLLGVEVAFNVFPSTLFSSLILQASHLSLLLLLYCTPVPSPLPTKPQMKRQ